ncbi:MAG: hypothetical protein Q7L19_01980 [Pseudohongiella sp.]|nr:hypothetical protein [Pseudohongiella sp.]
MSTKSKATPAKAVPAKKAPAKVAPTKTSPEATPELNIKVIKSAETTSLTGTGVLCYEIGKDDSGETYYRITANNAGGFFSKEWVSWTKIYAGINGHDPITSILFRGLFRGKSVNTAGFLLAALKDQKLIACKAGKSRHYTLTEAAHKLQRKD